MKKVFIKDNLKFECDINYFYSGSKIKLLVNGKETKRMIKSDRNKLFFKSLLKKSLKTLHEIKK